MESRDKEGWPVRKLLRWAGAMDAVDLSLRLALLDLLLRPVGIWAIRPLVLGLAIIGLLWAGQLRKPILWLSLALLTGARVVLDWPLADNHAYLLFYWCFAISVALVAQDTRSCLAMNGRVLIGLVFIFATFWKLVSPDYLNGVFFQITMLTDGRFEGFARLVGGLEPGHLEQLREFVEQHVDGPTFSAMESPGQPARFLLASFLATFWTIAIEGAVAIAFLWPVERGVSKLRDTLLLAFCATTYAVATVEGFGWLLISMGFAQCTPQRRTARLLYLAVFGLILFYREVPWANLIMEAFLLWPA